MTEIGQEYTLFNENSGTMDLFRLALDVLNEVADAGIKQEIIVTLVSDNGLSCIRAVVDRHIPHAMASNTAAKCKVWKLVVCPLFSILTHENVVHSGLLEEKVAAIYTFLAGVGGVRLPVWFNFVETLCDADGRPSDVPSIGLVELSLAVLSKMLDCTTSILVNETFVRFARNFIDRATMFEPEQPKDKFSKLQASQYASFIGRRLEIGDAIPYIEAGAPSARAKKFVAFQLRHDLPGELSTDGPRHDNDQEDISRISIMPTAAEIFSTRGEYLPTIDVSTWHRTGISGRLDREFRLLREDTVGQLRDVVRAEIESLQAKQKGPKGTEAHLLGGHHAREKDSIRYCTYHGANIVGVDLDHRHGVEFLVQFQQPARHGSKATSAPGSDPVTDKKSLRQRRDWWTLQAKKRLQPGGLVCAIDASGTALFFVVADSTQRTALDDGRHRRLEKDNDGEKSARVYSLADDPAYSFVRLALATAESDDQLKDGLEWLLQSQRNNNINNNSHSSPWRNVQSRVLVEFPGILLDSFVHTLKGLQSATKKGNIPFAELIAPGPGGNSAAIPGHDGESVVNIPPPKYAAKPGFVFNMDCLAESGQTLRHSLQNPLGAEEVCAKTKLDETQSIALLEALSRSVALIQGPPGTGKTFAGVEILKVLLANQRAAQLGPIMIVCYTNHALDQLLEHILDANAKTRVIRMGSQSKSERLADLNLRAFVRSAIQTKIERQLGRTTYVALKTKTTELQGYFMDLNDSQSPKAVIELLEKRYREYYFQLFGLNGRVQDDYDGGALIDGDGFTTVQGKRQDRKLLDWRNGGTPVVPSPPTNNRETHARMRERLKSATNLHLHSLTHAERGILYEQWQTESFRRTKNYIAYEYSSFVEAQDSDHQTRREVDLRCLMGADIVGVTTTGLARNLKLLKHLRSKVLVCEEAGEVLEAHMLTSLLPSVEHVILIGDHQQLRPQVQNYDLRSDNPRGRQYSFDMSLFERLVSPPNAEEPRLPFSQLATQRRMHPSISALIRTPLYPALKDGPNVPGYPPVPGMAQRLFWMQHQHLEHGASESDRADPTSTSRTNAFEVEMTAALVSHLFKQGVYSDGDIAVLTPYLGQMMLLQRRFSSMYEITLNDRDLADLEAAADLDASANDESPEAAAQAPVALGSTRVPAPAKAVLGKSVRIATVDNFQGEEAKVVVVSLVRSNTQGRCGFLSTSNRINVLLSRAKHGMFIIGNSDTCSRVPMWQEVIAMLQSGGNLGPALTLRCNRHPERTFEASNPDHFSIFAPDGGCMLPCDKRLSCGHACTGPCHSDVIHAAIKCLEPCPRPLKGCSHACTSPCGAPCIERCSVRLEGEVLVLPCSHPLSPPICWQKQDPVSVQCTQKVTRTVPGCAHTVTVPCHANIQDDKYRCKAACGAALPCGHTCKRACYQCKTRKNGEVVDQNHGSCSQPCGRGHGTCQHACVQACHSGTACVPCAAKCEVQCSHSKCGLACNEPCVPCAEEACASRCPHAACTMPYVPGWIGQQMPGC